MYHVFLQPINNINNNSTYLEKKLKSDFEISTRIWNMYIYKVYQKYKNTFLWISLIMVIFFNIVQYAAIVYYNGNQDIAMCLYGSISNYFTGSQNGNQDSNEIVSIAYLAQSVIAYFTNTFFIVKIVEGIFLKKKKWNV